jgi:hypothetical protein
LWATDHTLNETLLATQRPWLWVEVVPDSDLAFDAQGGKMLVKFNFKNTGKSPAIHVAVGYEMFPTSMRTFDPRKEQIRACSEAVKAATFGLGNMVFPDETVSYLRVSDMSRADIEKELEKGKPFTPPRQNRTRTKTVDGTQQIKWIDPVIVGCVTYKFTFGPDVIHHTGFLVRVGARHPPINSWLPIDSNQARIDQKDLRFDKAWAFLSEFAD